MKHLLSLLSLSLCTLFSWAEEVNAMLLHLASGEQVVCKLDEQPVITFQGDELVLRTHMNEVRYNAADVLKFTYIYADPSSINDVNNPKIMFSFIDNLLTVNGATPNTDISVYSVDGSLVATSTTNNYGKASISLPDQSGKTYVVKTSIANFKIAKP